MKAEFTISNERHTSKVVRQNNKTVFVIAPDGNVIKRHVKKHNVVMI